MPNTKFDAKSFNPQAFGYLVSRVPSFRQAELRKSRALTGNADIRRILSAQDGTGYARLAMRGLLDGDAVNYDGQTDIEATNTKTFEQGVVSFGRAKAWVERDFSYDITGGVDFMDNVAQQVAEYWINNQQGVLLAILKGIFSMSGDAKNVEFVDKHTYDITGADDGKMTVTTLNSAMQSACGANKKKFTLVFTHSVVATNLENTNLIAHLKYTDKDGVTKDLDMYTWAGRLVIVDDGMPVIEHAAVSAGEGVAAQDAWTEYTTYILGDGAFSFEDLGAKVPYEMNRDPKTNGGQDTLYTRKRLVLAPFGISYEKKRQATLSPTDAELASGENWSLVHSGEEQEADRSYINHKVIPIARILSRG